MNINARILLNKILTNKIQHHNNKNNMPSGIYFRDSRIFQKGICNIKNRTNRFNQETHMIIYKC